MFTTQQPSQTQSTTHFLTKLDAAKKLALIKILKMAIMGYFRNKDKKYHNATLSYSIDIILFSKKLSKHRKHDIQILNSLFEAESDYTYIDFLNTILHYIDHLRVKKPFFSRSTILPSEFKNWLLVSLLQNGIDIPKTDQLITSEQHNHLLEHHTDQPEEVIASLNAALIETQNRAEQAEAALEEKSQQFDRAYALIANLEELLNLASQKINKLEIAVANITDEREEKYQTRTLPPLRHYNNNPF